MGPSVRIAIDRDATVAAQAKHGKVGIVAVFLDPITLYRILDGEELVRIEKTGRDRWWSVRYSWRTGVSLQVALFNRVPGRIPSSLEEVRARAST